MPLLSRYLERRGLRSQAREAIERGEGPEFFLQHPQISARTQAGYYFEWASQRSDSLYGRQMPLVPWDRSEASQREWARVLDAAEHAIEQFRKAEDFSKAGDVTAFFSSAAVFQGVGEEYFARNPGVSQTREGWTFFHCAREMRDLEEPNLKLMMEFAQMAYAL